MSNLTLDIEKLLQPVSKDQPSGTDLRLDASPESKYFLVKDARANARNIERKQAQGDQNADPAKHWATVLKTSQEILQKQSKDIEVACWLTEALVRKTGLHGLLTGFELLNGLVDDFWDDLYPQPDEDGLESKLAPLVGLNGDEMEGSLITPIYNVAITEAGGNGPYALWQYQQSLECDQVQDAAVKQRRYEQGTVPLENIKKAVADSSPAFYQDLAATLDACIQSYQTLDAKLTERCDTEAPPISYIIGALETFKDHLRFINNEAPFEIEPEAEADTTTDAEAVAETVTDVATLPAIAAENQPAINTLQAGNAINNREQALQQLQAIANYFRKAEPHSPIPYLLDRAAHWGKLALPDLLQELISDPATRGKVCHLTGIMATEAPITNKETSA